ncbi:DUF317 domain-containing protein [Streptomyces aculeolatus]|uniref:DUF317 domain-containing protein n=1 Tax=Streptomyces aculeolatus TaxID=270689 RepID=UPI001CEC52A1|nr:DUF317 domain-containing protein [Streptomyces aculeolatus]
MSSPVETVEVDFITPRHLAGGGDPGWITVPLHRACGWSHGTDPLMARVILSSPDQRAVLRLEPDPDGQWWTLHHAAEPDRRPAWCTSFGARTPVELIAPVTDMLTNPAGAASAPSDPYEPLRQTGWSPYDGGFVSPDGTAAVERSGPPDDRGAWCLTVKLGGHQQVWQARFSEHAPAHLITAFTAALADPTPIARTDGAHRLPTLDPDLITIRRTDVRAVLIAGALEDRIDTLAARHTLPPATPKPPAPPKEHGRSR